MWLIGRATEQRTRERWHALRGLSTDFLDVVRGLPTLRSFNRGGAQASPHRRGQRASPPRDDGDAAPHVPVGDGARAGGHPRRRARRGDGRRAAGRRRVGPPGRTDGARARPRALPAPAPAGRGVSRERRRPGGRRPDARAARRAGRGARGRAARASRAPRRRPCAWSTSPSPIRRAPAASSTGSTSSWRPARPSRSSGESGAGKSTVAALLLGFLEPTAGRVTVGGVDLAGCRVDDWRALVAWVPQHPTLVRGSVADNISLGAAGVRRARCARPRRLAGVDAFVGAPARTATRRSSATVGARSHRASAGGSGWRARSWAIRRSSSSTSRRPTSIPRAWST